ncbi:cGMP-dependent protein kinase 1-like isoform X2 [Struthio camelus]|uniref:cGMP-dependent protein kinase 1-like isoform X2 n=1 Tax=Struthio camelus TaxID=8801 RepID=UPI0036042CE9
MVEQCSEVRTAAMSQPHTPGPSWPGPRCHRGAGSRAPALGWSLAEQGVTGASRRARTLVNVSRAGHGSGRRAAAHGTRAQRRPGSAARPGQRRGGGMDRRLRELRLREERAFLRSVARGGSGAGPGGAGQREPPAAEPPHGRRDSRAQPIVPEPLASDAELRAPAAPLSPRDRSLIAEAVSRSAFLRRLGPGCPQALAQSFVPVRHGPGDTVLAEGDEGAAMYVVAEGQLSVTQRGRPLRTLGPGDVFGELAILYHCKRTATVQALTAVRLWAIDRQRYRAIATSNAKQRRAEILGSLRAVHWLQGLSDTHLSKLLDAMEECTFAPGHVIIREGDEGENFYIILKGEVRVSRKVDGKEKVIRVLGAGEHFGEISLLQNIRRTASCQAQGHVTCITVAKEDFLEISPFCPKQHEEPDAPETPSPVHPRRAPASPGRGEPPRPARLEELAAVRYEDGQEQGRSVILGTGGFGRVELVRCREQLFALKRIRKDWVVQTRQQEHVRTERFFGSFRDGQYVYLLLEFCQGGELWTKLREVRCFEEPTAVFCSACVVEALGYLHGHGIVYRDLKPENLMLDKQGYVKLVDFGFAKVLGRGEKTYSFCGTPEYLAPEILRQEGHDFAVDFWMLGILIFEMLVGRPPFHSAEPQKIYSRILDGIFSFPAFLSEAACSLIAKLCRRRPGQRLGNTASGIRGIKKHRWFAAMKWKKLLLRQLPAPTLALIKEGPPYINFKRFSADWTPAGDERSGWDEDF